MTLLKVCFERCSKLFTLIATRFVVSKISQALKTETIKTCLAY